MTTPPPTDPPKTVVFTRYEGGDLMRAIHDSLAKGHIVDAYRYSMAPGESARVQDFLRDELLAIASRPSVFDDLFPPTPRRPWYRRAWTRLTLILDAWAPRLHLGPCDHDDCERW